MSDWVTRVGLVMNIEGMPGETVEEKLRAAWGWYGDGRCPDCGQIVERTSNYAGHHTCPVYRCSVCDVTSTTAVGWRRDWMTDGPKTDWCPDHHSGAGLA